MTLVGYFNSLRELGGMRRLVEDEVRTRCDTGGGTQARWARRRRTPGSRDRKLETEPVELTSRENTGSIKEAKARLAHAHRATPSTSTCVLASNMISVGLDIDRLGLMVVAGPAEDHGEYIQATSRVGRDEAARAGRHLLQRPQAARPLALRALRGLSRELLPLRRGRPA